MWRPFRIPISWTELLKRTYREINADNVLGLAAQLAYYTFLALFPALLFLIALAGYFPGDVVEQLVASMATVAPPEVVTLFRDQLNEIARQEQGGLLTFGILAALWSSSAAVVAIVDAMNRAYDIEDARPWWKVRLTALVLTVALALFVLLAFSLVLLGPTVADWLGQRMGFGPVFTWTWKILQWPIVFALVAFAIGCTYYFAPDAEQDWEWITPGAVVGTVLWLLASLGFKFYVANFSSYNETYGTVGGIIVLLLWFYISGLAILIGAEMNAEIEHASPYGKNPGEKVAGEKRKLGAAAARAFADRLRRKGKTAPAAGPDADVRSPEPSTRAVPAPAGGSGVAQAIPGALFMAMAMLVRRRPARTSGAAASIAPRLRGRLPG